jgi:hypothetical protein
MHFYSGPPMHLLSGVDRVPVAIRLDRGEMEVPDDRNAIPLQQVQGELFGQRPARLGLHDRKDRNNFSKTLIGF